MKIYFERSGGFAGMVTSITVDTKMLRPEEAREIQKLIEEAHFFNLPSKLPQQPSKIKGAADYYVYKITIQQNNEIRHSVQCTDLNLQSNLKSLIDYLLKNHQKWRS
jgi:hypothetical protein